MSGLLVVRMAGLSDDYLLRWCVSAEPIIETHGADARVVAGHKRSIVDCHLAVVESTRIRDDFTGIVGGLQEALDKFAHANTLRTGNFDHAVQRRGKRDV